MGPDASFDEEDEADVDTVCTIKMDPGTMAKELAKDLVIANVMRFTRGGWPPKDNREASNDGSIEDFRKVAVSLSTAHGCLLYGSRVVILLSLRSQVLQLGTLWDATDEAASTHCSLLAKNRCRNCGPLPSVYGLHRAPDSAAQACQPSLDAAGKGVEQSAC